MLQVATAATSSPKDDDDDGTKVARVQEPGHFLLNNMKGLLAITGVTLGVGTFAWTAYRVSMYVSGLSVQHGVAAGVYMGGAASTLVAVGGYSLVRRFLSIHPESLFKEVHARVRHDATVTELLGSKAQPGMFKAYAKKGGLVYKSRALRKSPLDMLHFERYGLQLIYQVHGPSGTMAMVSTEAVQSLFGGYTISNLSVDFDNGDRVVLIGSTKDVVYKGIVKLR